MFGGPSASGTSRSPSNNTAQAYIPQNQPGSDATYWNSLNNLGDLSSQILGQAQGIINNPYKGEYGANMVSGLGIPFGQGMVGQGQTLGNYGLNTLNTAFDPMQSLHNTQATQNLNRQNAINAMSGVAGTPYGAGVTGQNQQGFEQNWLNQMLQRQATGLQAGGAALTQGGQLGNTGLNTILSSQLAPYNTWNQQVGNQQNALLSAFNPQQNILQDTLNYLKTGQGASELSGQLGQMGTNQLGQAFGGINSLIGGGGLGNLAFGSGGLSGALGLGSGGLLGSLGGLFGGAGAAGVGSLGPALDLGLLAAV
jgi:hypothetical protein